MLEKIRICLVAPSHPGNIGGVARAMKTMALDRLFLIDPKEFPSEDAYRRSAGAEDILNQATVVSCLLEAVGDCGLVLGTTARQREIEWPLLSPAQCAEVVAESTGSGIETAIVFGTESSGLSNEDVELCHSLIRIPTSDEYSSLNLASACQIIAYEIFKGVRQGQETKIVQNSIQASNTVQLRQFYQHLQQTLYDLDFVKYQHPPVKLMRKLIRLINRARPDSEEINILRGALSAIQKQLNKS